MHYDIEKTAQQKSLLKTITREMNPVNMIRYLGSEKYRELYNYLKEEDENLRRMVIDKQDDLREYLHHARMAFKNREYAVVVYYSMKIVDFLQEVFENTKKLEEKINSIKNEILGLNTLEPEQIEEMKKKFEEKTSKYSSDMMKQNLLYITAAPEFISEATVGQWIKENIPTSKQLSGSLFERVFKNLFGKQKESARESLRIAENVFSSIKEIFGKLESSLTDPMKYISIVNDYKTKLNNFDKRLLSIYEPFKNISGAPTVNPAIEITPTQETSQAPVQTTEEKSEDSFFPKKKEFEQQESPVIIIPQEMLVPEPDPYHGQQESVEDFLEKEKEDAEKLEQEKKQLSLFPTASVEDLIDRAEMHMKKGEVGISASLLAKVSEIFDDYGDEQKSIIFIQAAEKVLNIK